MRITSLRIIDWRNLSDLRIEVPADANLICLIGENGTGKSNLLELLAEAATRLGLSTGVQLRRGSPLAEPHDIEVTLRVSDSVDLSSSFQTLGAPYADSSSSWNRTLTLRSSFPAGGPSTQQVLAGGVSDESVAVTLGSQIAAFLQQEQAVHHLYLDADRVFNPAGFQEQEVWGRARQDLKVPGYVRQQAALMTQNMYSEWLLSVLAQAIRSQNEYWTIAQEAARAGEDIPPPQDEMAGFRAALMQVLPHLRFERVDSDQRNFIFDSAGTELRYEQLSGGEREIAFLVGQIERFQLRQGLLLLDEPELHLNPELLRTWLAYIRNSIEDGQVWIATHALEAVEVAGLGSSFVMERSDDRRVRQVGPISDRPALATLAGAVGSPAFSLARSRFILVEGTRPRRERERFGDLLDAPPSDKFVEAGSCSEVIRKLEAIRELAAETDQLRVGGVIDRDSRTDAQALALEAASNVHVLPCHEVENFFLYPPALGRILEQGGRQMSEVLGLLQTHSDPHAGRWILHRAAVREGWQDLDRSFRENAGQLKWADIEPDINGCMRALADSEPGGTSEADRTRRRVALVRSAREYAALRDSADDFWKQCFGKQVLSAIPGSLGLSSAEALEARVVQLWKSGEVARPPDLESTRAYLESIPVI